MDVSDFSRVVGSIYDCAFDAGLWPQTLAEIGGYTEGAAVRIFLFNHDVKADGFCTSLGLDSAFNQRFDNDIETLNSIRYGFVVSDLDVPLTLDEILGTNGGRDVNGNYAYDNRYYRDWMVPLGYHDVMATLMVKNERHFGGLAMARSKTLPRYEAQDREKVRLLAPHIRRALTIGKLIERQSQALDRAAQFLDGLATPVVLVDKDGVISQMNAAAEEMLRRGDTLAQGRRSLTAAHPQGRQTLQGLLDHGGQEARSVALQKAGGGDVIASLIPLAGPYRTRGDLAVEAQAAIFFHDPDRPPPLPGEALAKLYGLTGGELRILLALAQGATLQLIAEKGAISLSTVRSHLKSIFMKTGKSRQAELVELVLRAVPPVRTS